MTDTYDPELVGEFVRFPGKTQPSAKINSGAAVASDSEYETFTAAELDLMEFGPVQTVVPGIFVEGLTLFCGKPKGGKSWLLLHASHATASNGFTLGTIHCMEGDVLYCSLEDNKRRLKSRMRKLFGNQPRSPRLHFKVKMPRLAQGGIDMLRTWIKSVPNPRMIAIDTLAMVRMPNRKDQSMYDADYAAVVELRNLAHEFGIAVVVVHHIRKMEADDPFDTVSGTLGLTGCPDAIVILKRDASGTSLIGKGRDLEEFEKAITFNKNSCTWRIEGDAEDVRRSTQQKAIIEAIEEADGTPMTPAQVAGSTGMKRPNVKFLLGKMHKDGVLTKQSHGKYQITPKPKKEANPDAYSF
jgi:RecA-family ATPase